VALTFAVEDKGILPDRMIAALGAGGVRPPSLPLSETLRWARRHSESAGWRAVVDGLRPFTQSLWREADLSTRRRFLRHLRPWWDVHRHRTAPAVADRLAAMHATGQLAVLAGSIAQTTPDGEGAAVTWRARADLAIQSLRVDRIINCTGPAGGPSQVREPLVRDLLGRRAARMDSLGLGLEVDDRCRLITGDGSVDLRLYAVGPLTRGSFWEIVAAPDIRNQVAMVAELVAAVANGDAASPRPGRGAA